MTSKGTLLAFTATALAAGALAGGAVALNSRDNPVQDISAIHVDHLAVEPSSTLDDPDSTGNRAIAALDVVEGTFHRRDDDEFGIGSIELEIGPDEWVRTAGKLDDFDGDGKTEKFRDELNGMVGKNVAAKVRLDDDGDDADVFQLNNLTYRDSAGGPAPWQNVTESSGTAASRHAVASAAIKAVGAGSLLDDLDRERNAGDVAWTADVDAAHDREYTVLLDIAGKVLDVQRED